jgi:hypothetical protein
MRITQNITHMHPTHLGGGIPHTPLSRKIRNKTNTPTIHPTANTLTNLLDTNTDIKFADTISQLPDTWHCKTKHDTTLTKKILERCAWGSYKDDQSISQFQAALLRHNPSLPQATQYDTALSHSIANHQRVWNRNMKNTLTQTSISHPLQPPITIFQIYYNSHYTTLITDSTNYNHYEGLNLPSPPTIRSSHNKLGELYTRSTHNHTIIPSLQQETPMIKRPNTPPQTDN